MTVVCPKCNHADFDPKDECPKCGVIYAKVLRSTDIVANAKQSGNWANVPPSAVARALREIVLTTTHSVPGRGDFEIIDVVSAEVAFGMNLLKDLFTDITDVMGGRSGSTQNVLRDAKHTALTELRRTALQAGADAVVGIDLDYSEFSGGGKSMLFIVASGTAVRFTQ